MNRRILGMAVLVGVVLPAIFVMALGAVRSVRPAATTAGRVAPGLPDFALEDQDGRMVRTSDLRGRPVVVSFFFTSCASICPIAAAHLVRLQQAVAEEDVAFVSFSIDPERDDASARREYLSRWAPAERRWHLLAPSREALADIAAGLGVPLDPGSVAALHTTSLLLLAPGGRVHRTWSTDTPLAEEVAALYALIHPQVIARDDDGAALYRRLGCGGCHDDAALAPDLTRLGPRTAEQLRNALVAPGEEVAKGYRNAMPSYRDALSDAQLTLLVGWLSRSPSVIAPSRGTRREAPADAVDPVCGMAVHRSELTPHAVVGGTDRWFCSESCLQTYLADSARLPR